MSRILIVEDDPFLSEMYTSKLEEAGFSVDVIVDGKEGLKKILEDKPDLVLLDIVLPKMDGFEILQAVRKEPKLKEIKIIALTNLGQKEEIEKGLAFGANDYIVKAHYTPSEVVAKVRKILEK